MNTTTLASAGGPHISLASLFAQAQPSAQATACARLLRRRVVLPIAAVSGLLALWCAWAPLSGAVVAAGQVQTELGRKVVQHQEGGIVREVLVRQGQAVRRGEPLLVVSDLRSDATLDILRKQQGAEELRSARARAELNMAPSFAWPVGGAVSGELLTRERQLFETRRQTLVEQIAAMESQMRQAHARATALAAQLEASDRSTQLVRDELAMNVKLAEGGFVQKTRLLMLERGVADMQARAEATRGQIAEARMQISSLTNAIAQARGAYQQRAADELKDAGARLREIEDRLRPSQDQVDRQTVRAPVDGTVMALRVTTSGTVVGPREPLLEIAPSSENLIVEMRIDPHDIDYVYQGAAAEVRLSAFNVRRSKLLKATVSAVSPDAMTDPSSKQPWYTAQVEVPTSEMAKQPQLRLQAGMPAEVFVTTPSRSLLEYLLEPLGIFARRALREP